MLGTGTSGGVPIIACNCDVCSSDNPKNKRLRSSVMIETQGKIIVIDAGPDFRMQMIRENIKMVDTIILTHEHRDHTSGLDDIRPFTSYQIIKEMNIFAEKTVIQSIKKQYEYIFSDSAYIGLAKMNLIQIENKPFECLGIPVIPIRAIHGTTVVLGFRINNFAYLTDFKVINEKEKKKLFGLDILILGTLRKKEHVSHLNLFQALSLVDELKPKSCYLTHIGHQMGKYEDVSKELPKNVFLSYDGMKLKC